MCFTEVSQVDIEAIIREFYIKKLSKFSVEEAGEILPYVPYYVLKDFPVLQEMVNRSIKAQLTQILD